MGSVISAAVNFFGFQSVLANFSMFAGPLGWAVAAVVAVATVINWAMPQHTEAEDALSQMPTKVWTTGPVMAVTGLLSIFIALDSSPSSPLVQELAVPTSTLDMLLAGAQPLGDTIGSKYDSVYLQQGSDADRVVIVTPGANPDFDVVNVYTVKKGLQVAAPGDVSESYISLFARNAAGKLTPNPDAVEAMNAQQALAMAALKATDPQKAVNAQRAAASVNKYSTVAH